MFGNHLNKIGKKGDRNTKRGKVVGIAASVAIVIAAVGLFYFTSSPAQLNAQPNKEVNVIAGQYVDYPDLRNLTGNADAIVVGKVTELKGTHGHPAAEHIPVTDFSITADVVLKGDLKTGDTITVQQFGGGQGNCRER